MASLTCVIIGNAKDQKKTQSASEKAIRWDGWAKLVGLIGLTMVIRTGMKFGLSRNQKRVHNRTINMIFAAPKKGLHNRKINHLN